MPGMGERFRAIGSARPGCGHRPRRSILARRAMVARPSGRSRAPRRREPCRNGSWCYPIFTTKSTGEVKILSLGGVVQVQDLGGEAFTSDLLNGYKRTALPFA